MSSATVSHGQGNTFNEVSVNRSGSVSARGAISNDVDPTKDGVTVERVQYDTSSGSLQARITANQTGKSVSFSRSNNGGVQIGTEDANGQGASVSVSRAGNVSIQGKNGRSVNISKEDIARGARLLHGLFGGR